MKIDAREYTKVFTWDRVRMDGGTLDGGILMDGEISIDGDHDAEGDAMEDVEGMIQRQPSLPGCDVDLKTLIINAEEQQFKELAMILATILAKILALMTTLICTCGRMPSCLDDICDSCLDDVHDGCKILLCNVERKPFNFCAIIYYKTMQC